MRTLLLFIALINAVTSINILIYLIGTNQFERNSLEFLAQQLALRHHNVITIKPILIPEEPRLVKPKLHLVREKVIKNVLSKEIYQSLEVAIPNVAWKKNYDADSYLNAYYKSHNASCYKLLNSNLIDSLKKESIDLSIVYSGNPCLLAINHLVAIPTIYYDTEGFTDETVIASATPINLRIPPTSCAIPETSDCQLCSMYRSAFCYTQEMIAQMGLPVISSLVSRRYAKIDEPITSMFANDYTIKKTKKHFPNVNILKHQSVAFFVNSDPLLEPPRAIPPNVIHVGGMHIDHPKPLFSPWNTTIERAEKGMIIVTFGTQADSSKMSSSQAKAVLGALSKLTDYRIYWRVGPNMKVDGIDEEKVPSHINLTTYIPQNDLLAHKACKLLVTNGGMSSIMEAVAHGVPIVGVPLYGSNRANLAKVAAKSLGVIVEKYQLSESSLLAAMKKVLDTVKYKTTAKEMSKEFKSRATGPFAAALHTIDHIGRHLSFAFFQPPYIPIWQRTDFIACIIFLILPILIIFKSFTFWSSVLFSRKTASDRSEKGDKKHESKKNR
ncbi:unnamed protein product [Caenorhabditis bovis]|uniref:glucuronosyltransferase n=1 Tax=Caenorhabditis bovis TaxID=2654633 RepID=A0A8S1EB40_9PELO|nr:unnamed protein product [Caenorhabditis bovis]